MKVLSRVGAFELIDVLGHGGMGVVYRARHASFERLVAVKVIGAERSHDAGFRERFRREALAAAAVEHPHIVPVYDAGEADGVLYLAMRLIDGPDLRTLLRREGRLPPGRAVALLAQVAAALEEVHRPGLLHRDVKPSNVLVERMGSGQHAYLSDFGLARSSTDAEPLTAAGTWVGTPDYAAPEQLCGEPLDARTDVYALGCVLYQSLTGTTPFEGRDVTEKLCSKLAGALPPPLPERRDPAGASDRASNALSIPAAGPRDGPPRPAARTTASRACSCSRPSGSTHCGVSMSAEVETTPASDISSGCSHWPSRARRDWRVPIRRCGSSDWTPSSRTAWPRSGGRSPAGAST